MGRHIKRAYTYISITTGIIFSLKNVREDAEVMQNGTECGIGFDGWGQFEVGDVIQCYDEIIEKRKLV